MIVLTRKLKQFERRNGRINENEKKWFQSWTMIVLTRKLKQFERRNGRINENEKKWFQFIDFLLEFHWLKQSNGPINEPSSLTIDCYQRPQKL
jgi:hypothetical protein